MATNAGPIYGKQYIRYAETWQSPQDAEAGSPAAVAAGTTAEIVEAGELHAVAYSVSNPSTPSFGFAVEPKYLAPANWTGAIVGINQAYLPSELASPQSARQLTVATSGLLLVEVDPAATMSAFVLNSQLRVDTSGRAVPAGGTLVTLDGTTPLIREPVTIGGRKLVLVSFA